YNEMVLEADRVSSRVTIVAAVCSWWTMAGFLILPGAFVSLSRSKLLQAQPDLTQHIQVTLPILAVLCFLSGAGVICFLWRKFHSKNNYVWLSNRLLLPTLVSAANSLYAILVNIYTAQEGYWS
ncbi:hypothetical protein GQ53DRAFT_624487, partial [Thozetella sp. PMI_491]